ncbi:MAG: hypothetical protein FWC39_07085 [Bacteroidetes bacterium]|nr:hypothetical protein [Bacteroidota bacterium]
MKIEEMSIFGEYKQPENRVTAAFLQICKIGGEDFIRFMTNQLKIQLPSSEIEITSQVKGSGTIPDGLLESNFSFRLFVESKITPNAVNHKQLLGHKQQIKSVSDFLLYLTPDEGKPAILGDTYWVNWLRVISIFEDYLQTSHSENNQLLEFLIGHFKTLLENLNLLKITWDLNNENVIILAGSWAEGVALKYNYYICQNKRSFKPARYLAFYNNGQIRHIFEILKTPENDVELSKRTEFTQYIEQAEPHYIVGNKRKVFTLKHFQDIEPVINDSIDKNGKPCPYTYGQPRYTTLTTLQKASKTSELR